MASSNRITKVALIGANGRLGTHLARALVATGKHQVTAITRAGSAPPIAGITPAIVDYSNEASVVDALRGQQFLVMTMNRTVPPETHSMFFRAAAAAGVPYVMPNAYGHDHEDDGLAAPDGDGVSSHVRHRAQEIQALGVKSVVLVNGFWYQWSLANHEPWFGFEIAKREVTFFDDGAQKISVSTMEQCGRAVAGLLSLPITSEGGACVDDWANKSVYVASFSVSQRDMLASVCRVTGTSESDWTIKKESAAERHAQAIKDKDRGDMFGFVRMLYTRVFFADGAGNHEARRGLANDALGLTKDDLDFETRYAVEIAESGRDIFKERFLRDSN